MRKYKVVVVGAGNIGALFDTPDSKEILTHANAFLRNEHFQLMGFFDVDRKKTLEAARRWQVKAYTSLDEAMEEADVVSCTVPDAYHFEVLKKIAEYPIKLVFAEKPITKNQREAQEICGLYDKRNIPLQVNYTRRFVTEFMELKKKISEYGKFLRGTGYYGKGILHNGSHMIDFIRYLLGDITDTKSNYAFIDFEEDDPCVEAELKVAGGVFFMHPLDCSVATLFEIDLFFDKGRIRMTDGCMKVEEYKVLPSETYAGYYNYISVQTYSVQYDSSFKNAVNNIYNVLENKEELICTKEDAKKVLEICKKLQKC